MSSPADQVLASFLESFWDPAARYFTTYSDRRIHPEHAIGPRDGLYTDFWWEAQLWDLVMDAHERTGLYEELIHDIYDGFAGFYPDFLIDYNDDMGWWAQGSARAYELTGQDRYLDRARSILDSIWAHRDATYNGGIWWRRSVRDQKNVATNGPAAITSVKVYAATGDTQYLDRAQTLYSWIKSNLQAGGAVYDRIEQGTSVKTLHTYNPGYYIGAATALYKATRDGSYLSDALSTADWVLGELPDGLPFEGIGDGAGFKPVLVRHLHRLAVDLGQPQYLPYLRRNAARAWENRRVGDGLIGPDWSSPAPDGPLQSLTAGAGAAVLQIVAL
ncbi:glycoside hydrolase family 76 protein [Kribbella sancticallisti]|uniref:Glycoside hydrolase family 76 protein n=1 Tax=Kribbella sancticallisti TaxID=460087 RepID=A0ABP4P2Q9_9ACTN